MTNIAVILAGGIGQRAGEGLPKQFRTLADGRMVLQTCVDAFRACRRIDYIVVVVHPDWIEKAQSLLPADITLIAGGKERWESSWKAIQWCTMHNAQCTMQDNVNILLHDCARPFVSQRILNDVCEALEQHNAVTVAVSTTDTMYQVEQGTRNKEQGTRNKEQGQTTRARLVDIPDRTTLMRAQTPQAFRLNLLYEAYQIAVKEPNLQATDDCGIVHKYLPNTPIHIVEGEENNRKLTFQEDFEN